MVDKIGDNMSTIPRVVDLKREGIYYSERGPNQAFMNVVEGVDEDGNRVHNIVAAITENELMNQFTSASFGKIIVSIPFIELFKMLEEHLRNKPNEE
jgi:protoporphyrinogen oxidase